jgi:zinc transport system ATP-binding protein
MDIPAIEVKDLWFTYDKLPVLKEVNFTLKQDDFMAILGPNGGGKTTLLKLMLGILEPSRGEIRVFGKRPRDARERLGYVPQSTDIYSHEDKEKVAGLLKKVGMWDYRFWPIGSLSGGQRQRIFIARALAVEPEILFLDEPTASVDREFEIGLYELLKELNKKVTIVVITHDVGVVSRYVKSVACVNHTLIFHNGGKITNEMIDMAYACPVDLIAHGIPHRVLPEHEEE